MIAFALSSGRWDRIIAIEKDQSTLACAQHNAEVYDVLDKITWVHGDSFEVMRRFWKTHGVETGTRKEGQEEPQAKEDNDNIELDTLLTSLNVEEVLVFASPPWGGVSYRDQEVFDLSKMEPYNLEDLYKACSSPSSSSDDQEEGPTQTQKQILPQALFLPRQSDLNQIAALVPEGAPKIDVVQYCQKGASKALVAYLPGNIDVEKEQERRQQQPEAEAKRKSEEEESSGQKKDSKKRKHDDQQKQEQEDHRKVIPPELLTEVVPVAQSEVEVSMAAPDAFYYDTSYAQEDTSYLETGNNTPSNNNNNTEKKNKRKRRRRSSHNK